MAHMSGGAESLSAKLIIFPVPIPCPAKVHCCGQCEPAMGKSAFTAQLS